MTVIHFVIYERPADFPDVYVLRPYVIDGTGPRPHPVVCVADDPEALRGPLREQGLVPLAPWPGDDPVILETWV
jgi:hypothetical protein